MSKVIYAVGGYIPSDEDVVVINIYKLQSIGCKYKKYGWVSILNSGGVGTATDNWGEETEIDAIIALIPYMDDLSKIVKTNNFDDVLTVRDQFKAILEAQIKKNKNE